MNALLWTLAGASLIPATAAVAAVRREKRWRDALVLAAVVAAAGSCLYAATGRYNDWSVQTVDDTTDWQLAARLTQARRAVKADAADAEAVMRLAQAYYDAGRYRDAVSTLEEAQARFGQNLETMSLKAHALYYRDGRMFSPEAKRLVQAVLAANPVHVPVRLLLANDAFLHERWQEAIQEWELLLQSGAAESLRPAIRNAVAKARERLAQSSKTNQ